MFYIAERPSPNQRLQLVHDVHHQFELSAHHGRASAEGPFYDEHDNINSAPVLVIDEELARSLFPGEEAMGAYRDTFPRPRTAAARIVRYRGACRPVGPGPGFTAKIRSEFYMPFLQVPESFTDAERNDLPRAAPLKPDAAAKAVADTLRAIDSDMPVYNIRTMNEIIGASSHASASPHCCSNLLPPPRCCWAPSGPTECCVPGEPAHPRNGRAHGPGRAERDIIQLVLGEASG